MKAGFYDTVPQQDRRGRLVVRVVNLRPLPSHFTLAVGDAAHNMRAALDHIAFAFAEKALTPEEERAIQFPLASSSKSFLALHARCLPKVQKKAVAGIEQFQPYHRKKSPNNKMLGQLQAIDNWDKHRKLPITATRVKRCNLKVEVTGGEAPIAKQVTFKGTLKEGTALARFELANRSATARVKVNGKIAVIPIFDNGMQKEVVGLSVVTFLHRVGAFVGATVIPQFEALG